jgi:hypothetical protein
MLRFGRQLKNGRSGSLLACVGNRETYSRCNIAISPTTSSVPRPRRRWGRTARKCGCGTKRLFDKHALSQGPDSAPIDGGRGGPGVWGGGAYYGGPQGDVVYYCGDHGPLQSFKVSAGKLTPLQVWLVRYAIRNRVQGRAQSQLQTVVSPSALLLSCRGSR